MPVVKSVGVTIKVDGYEDARLKIDKLSVASDELSRLHPEITPQVNSAKALLEARLLRAGIKKELSKGLESDLSGSGGGGLLSGLKDAFAPLTSSLSGGGGGIGSIISGIGGIGGGAGWAAIAAAAGALSVELTGLVSGLAAATAGVGAFGLLALPTFKKIETAYQGISAAQKTYSAAVALQKADPTTTHAKDAAAALVKLKLAEDNLSPSTKTAVGGIQSLVKTYEDMAQKFAPDALKVFNSGLRIANTLLPDLKPFATAAGGAIDGLLGKANNFFKSADFRRWLDSFSKLVGPSIGAIGKGIGQVMIQVGKLFTLMSAKDDVNAIHLAFTVIGGSIHAVTLLVDGLMKTWNFLERTAVMDMKIIIDGAAKLGGWVPGFGKGLRQAAADYDSFANRVLGLNQQIQGSAQITVGELTAIGNAALNAMSKARGAGSLAGIGSAAPHAAGGWASGLSILAEQGPELIDLPHGSYVHPAAETRRMLSGGGGNTYNISITLPNGADAGQGRRIVEAIRQFEKGSGKNWRAA